MKQKYRKILTELEEASDHNDMLSQRVNDLSGNYKILQDTLAIRDEEIKNLNKALSKRDETIILLREEVTDAKEELTKLVMNLNKFEIGGTYQEPLDAALKKQKERYVPKPPTEAMDKL